MNPARLELLLALADDELVIGHRHSEWTGWAPVVEEDIAFSSIAQDEIAHARVLYELAGPDVDALALGRNTDGYRNAILCERPNGDWAYTLARHTVYDTADDVRLEALESSSWTELAELVTVIRLEERYHLEHARVWLDRAGGNVDLRPAVAEAAGIFERLQHEDELVADGVLPVSNDELYARFVERIGIRSEPGGLGGRRGVHTDDFTTLWEDLTGLHRAHPGARW